MRGIFMKVVMNRVLSLNVSKDTSILSALAFLHKILQPSKTSDTLEK